MSPATVSNVITGKAYVNVHTRNRVLKAIRELNYRPNAIARGLTQKRMNTIGIVFVHHERSSEMNPYFSRMLNGILTVATFHEQNTTLCTVTDWVASEAVMSRLCDGRTDGILLLVPPADSTLVSELQETNTPFVLVNSHHPDPSINSVDVADQEGAHKAVTHLIGLGHRRIAFVLNQGDLNFHFGQERLLGYRRALATAGIAYDETLIVDMQDLHTCVPRWGRRDDPLMPTAAFCIFDQRAFQFMEILAHSGIEVPRDFSVVGFDDVSEANTSQPALTTVHQPVREIGEQAAQMLLSLISGTQDTGIKQLLPTELIARSSTGPVPIR